MKVLDFSFFSKNDKYDINTYKDTNAWSRPYEYLYAENMLDKYINLGNAVHNSAWGFEGVHVDFRKKLDSKYKCIHSDIVDNKHNLRTYKYNLLSEDKALENKFHAVLNISVLEHLPNGFNGTRIAIENLFKQVKEEGVLICTFDFPRVNLEEMQKYLMEECNDCSDRLNGINSVFKNQRYHHLNIVGLVLKKEKKDV